MSRLSITIITLVVALLPINASAEFKYLCTSVPGACDWAPPDAPALKTSVCHSRATGIVTLKGTAPCPPGSWPYSITNGEVDPTNNVVTAYAPLDNACDAGLCAEWVPHDDGLANVMCCENGGPCWDGAACGGVLYWCYDGVTNNDGTIECFNAEQL